MHTRSSPFYASWPLAIMVQCATHTSLSISCNLVYTFVVNRVKPFKRFYPALAGGKVATSIAFFVSNISRVWIIPACALG